MRRPFAARQRLLAEPPGCWPAGSTSTWSIWTFEVAREYRPRCAPSRKQMRYRLGERSAACGRPRWTGRTRVRRPKCRLSARAACGAGPMTADSRGGERERPANLHACSRTTARAAAMAASTRLASAASRAIVREIVASEATDPNTPGSARTRQLSVLLAPAEPVDGLPDVPADPPDGAAPRAAVVPVRHRHRRPLDQPGGKPEQQLTARTARRSYSSKGPQPTKRPSGSSPPASGSSTVTSVPPSSRAVEKDAAADGFEAVLEAEQAATPGEVRAADAVVPH